ncbi:MAG: class I SAM-dependent methyltransferase [Mycobacterium sp.]
MDETWDGIAEWYTRLVRDGSAMHEFSRDILLALLPQQLAGSSVLDLGCGEGIVARAVAARGATVVGIDSSEALIMQARTAERSHPAGASYHLDSYHLDDGQSLDTIDDESMDWVVAALSLNNVADLDAAITAVKRVLKPTGKLAFTVPHPCFEAPGATFVDMDGTVRRVVGDYRAEGFWRSTHPQSVRRAGNYHRTISSYTAALVDHGFSVEVLAEPAPDERVIATNPHRAALPPFLLVRVGR